METNDVIPEVEFEQRYAWQIGGWLILVAIGLIGRPLIYLYTIITYISDIIENDYLKIMYEQARNNSSFDLALFILWETLVNIGFFGVSIFLLYAFFTRRKYFPIVFTILLVASLVIPILDVVLANAIFGLEQEYSTKNIGKTAIAAMIWVPYMFTSERAKRTFVF
ncbi:MAG: DUF2569 domain-containing protein [Candidatus Kapabacteria bacterium]|nr:DUF2569 domain-containing protein [Candidatus Kapabacteria bacterium]